jgi:hypothetical protein
MDERERVLLTLAGVRVFMGVFWLSNLLWRLPTGFGEHEYWGVPHTLTVARAHALSPPLRSLVDDVLAAHTTTVGWIAFVLGLFTGLSLLLANAPGEWLYGYLMLILLSSLMLLLPVSRRMSLDDALGRDP